LFDISTGGATTVADESDPRSDASACSIHDAE
jgi:hypothetical protein